MTTKIATTYDFIRLLPDYEGILCEAEDVFASHRSIFYDLNSSYKANRFHVLFYSLVRYVKPKLCLELGVLSGFSLISMALAAQQNGIGTVIGIDLFEDYNYNSDTLANVKAIIDSFGLSQICSVEKGNAENYSPVNFKPDLLHIDLSNDGNIVSRYFDIWNGNVKDVILFEGGSNERDRVAWMKSFKRMRIEPVIERELDRSAHDCYKILAFPSLSVFARRDLIDNRKARTASAEEVDI